MQEPVSIAVVDDHPLVREGLGTVITEAEGFRLIAQGACAREAVEIAGTQQPDILLLDLGIPGGGLSALRTIMEEGTACKIVVLTACEDDTSVLEAFRLGASGYILKGISGTEVIQALGIVHRKGYYVSPELGAKLLAGISCPQAASAPEKIDLSSREAEIRALVRKGFSNKAIGNELNLSDKTVKHYLTRLFRKMNVHNRLELAMLVQENNGQPH